MRTHSAFLAALTLVAFACVGGRSLVSHVPREAAHSSARSTGSIVFRLDFDTFPVGQLSEEQFRAHVPGVSAVSFPADVRIAENGQAGRMLRAHFPAGRFGPRGGGASFVALFEPGDEYILSYRVFISPRFDFGKGGKLPGLCSGGGRYTGGRIPVQGDGWSARLAFRGDGRLAIYAYHVGMLGHAGSTFTSERVLPKGRWFSVQELVQVNHEGESDGRVVVWLDGDLAIRWEGAYLRNGALGRVNSICFSLFHGGADATFAPRLSGDIYVDDVEIAIPGSRRDVPSF